MPNTMTNLILMVTLKTTNVVTIRLIMVLVFLEVSTKFCSHAIVKLDKNKITLFIDISRKSPLKPMYCHT